MYIVHNEMTRKKNEQLGRHTRLRALTVALSLINLS